MTDRSKAPPLTEDLQGMVTGVMMMTLAMQGDWLLVDVEPILDGPNYTGQFTVTGRQSGTKLVVNVEVLPDGA